MDVPIFGRTSFPPNASTLLQQNLGMNSAPSMGFPTEGTSGPVHSNSALVDMLLRRSQVTRTGSWLERSAMASLPSTHNEEKFSPESSRIGERKSQGRGEEKTT
jgi:hypothetical protein